MADGAAGLRLHAFDLVTANAPWVPDVPGTRRVFADGGATGTELPCRLLHEASALLRPGGVAIVLALDVTCDDGRRPIRDLCAALTADGFTTAIVPTPLDRILPDLEQRMRRRQPRLVRAEHVAVVVAAPTVSGTLQHRTLVGAEALARGWAAWSPPPEITGAAS